jgi:hypothetical protein
MGFRAYHGHQMQEPKCNVMYVGGALFVLLHLLLKLI